MEKEGREGEVEGREMEGPQVTVEPGPLRALLRYWLETGLLCRRQLFNWALSTP